MGGDCFGGDEAGLRGRELAPLGALGRARRRRARHQDKSFTYEIKTLRASFLIKKAHEIYWCYQNTDGMLTVSRGWFDAPETRICTPLAVNGSR